MKKYLNNLKLRWSDDLIVIKGELISTIVKIDKLWDDIELRLKGGKNGLEEKSSKEKSRKD